MFKAKDAYTWCDIFMVLSWHQFDRYLEDIEFPLSSDISKLRPIAKEFVLGYYPIRYAIHATEWAVDDKAHQIFKKAYQDLIAKLGEAKTCTLIDWGPQLEFEHAIYNSLATDVQIICKLQRSGGFSTLSADAIRKLETLLQKYDRENMLLHDSIDRRYEELFKDDWGTQLLETYLPRDEGEENLGNISPTDTVWHWIHFFRNRDLLRAIKTVLNHEELTALNKLVMAHPDWKRTESWGYFHLHDLFELVEKL